MNDWKARLHANNNYARLIIRKSQQRLSRQHFSYLTTDDLNNNAAMGSTESSFYATLDNASNTLTPNYAKIKIGGMEKLEEEWLTTAVVNPLVNAIALELALHPSEEVESQVIPKSALQKLPQLLPNVIDLIFDGVDL